MRAALSVGQPSIPRRLPSTSCTPAALSLAGSARHLPGPGAYRTPPGVGKQTLSVKATLPVVSFGKGSRDALTKKVCVRDRLGAVFRVAEA
jgi:hypothetical protein